MIVFFYVTNFVCISTRLKVKLYALACDEETNCTDIIILSLNNINDIEYKSSFEVNFKQDESNDKKFKLAHSKAQKLLIVEFKQ